MVLEACLLLDHSTLTRGLWNGLQRTRSSVFLLACAENIATKHELQPPLGYLESTGGRWHAWSVRSPKLDLKTLRTIVYHSLSQLICRMAALACNLQQVEQTLLNPPLRCQRLILQAHQSPRIDKLEYQSSVVQTRIIDGTQAKLVEKPEAVSPLLTYNLSAVIACNHSFC